MTTITNSSPLTLGSIAHFLVHGMVVSMDRLKRLDPKLQESVSQLFTQILQHEGAENCVEEFGDEYYLKITRENAGPQEDLVAEAASIILSMPLPVGEKSDAAAVEAQSRMPLVREAFGVASDSSSGVRNFLTVANSVHEVATKVLGGAGGVANVAAGAFIIQSAVSQMSAATTAKDRGGQLEAFLTGLMGLSLLLVGVGMFLLFPGIAAGVGLPLVMKAAFAMYVIIAVRSVYMLQHMHEFRKGLSQILERTDLADDAKMAAALAYLESYTLNEEQENKLIRRVGKDAALEIQKLVPVLVADLKKGTPGTIEKAQALIEQVMEANMQQMSKQILLLLISFISLPCYLPATGLTVFAEGVSTILVFVTNLLWLLIDSRYGQRLWANITQKVSSCFQNPYLNKDSGFSVAARDANEALLAPAPQRPRSITIVRRVTVEETPVVTPKPVEPVVIQSRAHSFVNDYSTDDSIDTDVSMDTDIFDQEAYSAKTIAEAEAESRTPGRAQSFTLGLRRKRQEAPRRATAS
jgi:hypothetical protein